jgi:4-hydroxy-tetrahydrodipicolinate reductase
MIQWYTGEIAQEQIRLIHRHPELELVGAVVFHEEKSGLDVGEIAGIGPIGVQATADANVALALDADCVLYNAPFANYAEIPSILSSGKNVVTVVGGTYPKATPHYDALQRSCLEGQSSLLGSGIHPGLHGDYLPLLATSATHTIRHVRIREWGNMSGYVPTTLRFMGFGESIEDLRQREDYAEYMTTAYREMVQLVADGAGLDFDEVRSECDFAPATCDCENGLVRRGTAAGIRVAAHAMSNGRPIVTEDILWYVDSDLDSEWIPEAEHDDYVLEIDGEPNLKLRVGFSQDGGTILDAAKTSTAARMVNSIPVVCSADPGVLTALDVPVPRGWRPFRG